MSVTDDDTPGLVVSRSSLDVGEDGQATFTVRLATQPTVSVGVGVGDVERHRHCDGVSDAVDGSRRRIGARPRR